MKINTYFDEKIQKFRKAVESDKSKINQTFEEIKKRNNEIVKRLLYMHLN